MDLLLSWFGPPRAAGGPPPAAHLYTEADLLAVRSEVEVPSADGTAQEPRRSRSAGGDGGGGGGGGEEPRQRRIRRAACAK